MHYLDETHIFLFLIQVLVLLALTRGLGEFLRRRGQPALTGELLVGVVLGPTILGRFLPGVHAAIFPADVLQMNMLETMAWIGVLFLLLDTGLEIDFSVAWRQRGNALVIAFSDIVIPMLIAFVPCLFLPAHYLVDADHRILFALFMATVMTISAMPVAARILRDLNLLKADLGFLIMSALAVNDIVGWVLFTIVLGLFSQAAVSVKGVFIIFAATVGFAALALTAGRYLSAAALGALRRRQMPEPGSSLTFACLLALLFGAITQGLGIHALFGFFIAGVMIGEAKSLSEESRNIISQMVHAIFVPLFFASIGLKIDFVKGFDLFLVVFMCAIGIAGRYVGAWIGVSLTRVPRLNRRIISIAHTPGGMMEVVVAYLALESGIINDTVFVAIVFSAVFSSLVAGPWMRRALGRRAAVRVSGYLAGDMVIPALAAQDRAGAIRELARRAAVRLGPGMEERIADEAIRREEEYGTAVGCGVALPHVRMEGVVEPIVAFGRSRSGIYWDAPDGRPVNQVFLLVSPADLKDVHVDILAMIARVMQMPGSRVAIGRSSDEDLARTVQALFA
ncbi:MAG: cation:proton antiporter [Proteobacteria bacterium]|nr:cation:proton antiporter [Pseudomonadota bacterium]